MSAERDLLLSEAVHSLPDEFERSQIKIPPNSKEDVCLCLCLCACLVTLMLNELG